MLKSKLLKSQFLTYEIQVQLDIHLGLFLRLAVSDSKMCRAGRLPFKECPANTAACTILPLQHSGYSHCMAGSRTPGAPRSEVPVHSVMCLLEEYTLWSSSLSLKYVQCSIFFIKTEPLLKHCAGDLRIGVYTPVEFLFVRLLFLSFWPRWLLATRSMPALLCLFQLRSILGIRYPGAEVGGRPLFS